MDIALPALVATTPPQPGPGQDPSALATDAAFAALLASLVAAATAPIQVAEAGLPAGGGPATDTTTGFADAVALTSGTEVDGIHTAATAQQPVVAHPDSRTAALAAVSGHPGTAEATVAAAVHPVPQDPAETPTAGTATAAAADADADAGAPREAARPAAERVVPQPVAPPDSARLLARAVPATATVTAAVQADADTDRPHQTTPAAAVGVEAAPEARPVDASKAPAPAVPVRPTEQIVRVLAPLRAAPDGTYELGLELRPEGLGRVQLDVVIERGVVHVAMRADNEAAGQLLNRSLGELRQGLADAGLEAGRLGVQTDAREGGRHAAPERSGAQRERRHGDPHEPAGDDRPPTTPAYADARLGGVDLFL